MKLFTPQQKTYTQKIIAELEAPQAFFGQSERLTFPEPLFAFLSKAQEYFQNGVGLPLEIRNIPGKSREEFQMGYLKNILRYDDFDDDLRPIKVDGFFLALYETPHLLVSGFCERIAEMSVPINEHKNDNLLLYKVNYHRNWSRG